MICMFCFHKKLNSLGLLQSQPCIIYSAIIFNASHEDKYGGTTTFNSLKILTSITNQGHDTSNQPIWVLDLDRVVDLYNLCACVNDVDVRAKIWNWIIE